MNRESSFSKQPSSGRKEGIPLSDYLDSAAAKFGGKKTVTFLIEAVANKKRFRTAKEVGSVNVVLVKLSTDYKEKEEFRGKSMRDEFLSPVQYTINDLVEKLRTGKTTIKKWIDEGHLPAYQVTKGGTVYVAHSDVIEFVDKRRPSNASNGPNFEVNTKE